MATRDFIICFFGGGPLFRQAVSKLKRAPFTWYVDSVPKLPGANTGNWADFIASSGSSIYEIWQRKAASQFPGDTLGRIAVIAFSEGGQGMKALLAMKDASKIDVAIPVDALHSLYAGQITTKVLPPQPLALDPNLIERCIAFATLAAKGGPPSKNPNCKVFALTHSSVRPGMFASTTEVGLLIWNEATKDLAGVEVEDASCDLCPAKLHQAEFAASTWPNINYPVGTVTQGGTITNEGWCTTRPSIAATNFQPKARFCYSGFSDGWTIRRVANGLSIFGWRWPTQSGLKDPSGNRDHVFQADMVLPHMVEEYIVNRWNPTCSNFGVVQADGTVGAACTMGAGEGYFDGGPPAPLPSPYPMGVALPSLVDECPMPGPGEIIIGRPGDPCYTVTSSGGAAPDRSGPAGWTMAKVIAGAAGIAVGYLAYDAWKNTQRR